MNPVSQLRKLYTFLRWKLKLPRYIGKSFRSVYRASRATALDSSRSGADDAIYEAFCERGYASLPAGQFTLPAIDLSELAGKARDRIFFDASVLHWDAVRKFAIDVIEDERIKNCLLQYFDNRPWLWNIALNYSEPSDALQDSQLWHFDYGDTRQLHAMVYFSDVDVDCGPFTFFPAGISRAAPRSKLTIERFTDTDLGALGISTRDAVRLVGHKGECHLADPGRVLHQGARCLKPRLVMFLTFTTPSPMSLGGSSTISHRLRRELYDYYAGRYPQQRTYRREFFL